jgi:hypothetical protein
LSGIWESCKTEKGKVGDGMASRYAEDLGSPGEEKAPFTWPRQTVLKCTRTNFSCPLTVIPSIGIYISLSYWPILALRKTKASSFEGILSHALLARSVVEYIWSMKSITLHWKTEN